MFSFEIILKDNKTHARLGEISTSHGKIITPVFMPVGTQGTVKAMTHDMLLQLNVEIILGNTYHLYLRPGHKLIESLGGLHRFISWDRPILTDSGGFQVYSMSDLNKVTEKGVFFRSHIDGSAHLFTPESSIEVQTALGSDIIMAFDECTPYPVARRQAAESADLTARWAKRSKDAHQENSHSALFGIIQGGVYQDLRAKSAEDICAIGFDGYALGGLSVGEPKDQMFEIVEYTVPIIPEDKPHYLMGAGMPADIIEAVSMGIDMFDCVLPTRNARNGYAFTHNGKIIIKHAKYKEDHSPVDPGCVCYACQNFSRAYLRHLFMAGEITAAILLTIHNLHFYLDLLNRIRQSLKSGSFYDWMTLNLPKYKETYP